MILLASFLFSFKNQIDTSLRPIIMKSKQHVFYKKIKHAFGRGIVFFYQYWNMGQGVVHQWFRSIRVYQMQVFILKLTSHTVGEFAYKYKVYTLKTNPSEQSSTILMKKGPLQSFVIKVLKKIIYMTSCRTLVFFDTLQCRQYLAIKLRSTNTISEEQSRIILFIVYPILLE